MPQEFYVVTGASSGIGRALSCQLAEQGKSVLAVARNEARLQELQSLYPDSIHTLSADLSLQAERERVAEHVQQMGHVCGLVNNAGTIDPIALLQDFDMNSWHQLISINLEAPIFLTNALLPSMQAGCRIINITTVATNFVASGAAGYAITKAGLNSYTRYLSDELRERDILVTAAHPGLVRTTMVNHVMETAAPALKLMQAHQRFEKENLYLDPNLSGKFLAWVLLGAGDALFTGDVIGIYNKQYQALWHDGVVPSPYPDGVEAP